MLGTSFSEQVFIRICIFLLRFLPLLLAVTIVLALIIDHEAHGFVIFLEIAAVLEVFFYVIVYIPRSRWLQAPAVFPTLISKAERLALFDRAYETITDMEAYLTMWFNHAPLSEIRRENVKEFYAWAFLNTAYYGQDDEEELEHYTTMTEEALGRRLPPGRGKIKPIRTTIDPVYMQHRPLLWYMIIAAVDNYTMLSLALKGFSYYRQPARQLLSTFPIRPLNLLSRHVSPSGSFGYWYRPHTSRTRLPVLFIHGIGIGLWPYTNFLSSINGGQSSPDDGQVGIIALELLPLSSRITSALPNAADTVREILTILASHKITSFVLVGHSYGTIIASQLLHHRTTSRLISASLLIDPVCFLLHHPHIAYNFTRRPPRRANEWQLFYFSSTDPVIANTLGRHFFWAEGALWREELRGRNVTVVLPGQDLIVDTLAVGRYLAGGDDGVTDEYGSGAVGSYSDGGGTGGGAASGGAAGIGRRPYRSFAIEGEEDASVISIGSQSPSAEDTGADGLSEEGGEIDAWKRADWKGEGLDIVWLEGIDHSRIFETRAGSARMAAIARAYCAAN